MPESEAGTLGLSSVSYRTREWTESLSAGQRCAGTLAARGVSRIDSMLRLSMATKDIEVPEEAFDDQM